MRAQEFDEEFHQRAAFGDIVRRHPSIPQIGSEVLVNRQPFLVCEGCGYLGVRVYGRHAQYKIQMPERAWLRGEPCACRFELRGAENSAFVVDAVGAAE